MVNIIVFVSLALPNIFSIMIMNYSKYRCLSALPNIYSTIMNYSNYIVDSVILALPNISYI